MELTLKDLENMGVQAIADSPSELIQHMNKLGRNTVAQNEYISKIVTWLFNHKTDKHNNNDAISMFIIDWFDDRQIQSIKHVLNDTPTYRNDRTGWIKTPTKKLIKSFLQKGYKWVSLSYNFDSSVTNPKPIDFNIIAEFLWDLNDKLEAYEELND